VNRALDGLAWANGHRNCGHPDCVGEREFGTPVAPEDGLRERLRSAAMEIAECCLLDPDYRDAEVEAEGFMRDVWPVVELYVQERVAALTDGLHYNDHDTERVHDL